MTPPTNMLYGHLKVRRLHFGIPYAPYYEPTTCLGLVRSPLGCENIGVDGIRGIRPRDGVSKANLLLQPRYVEGVYSRRTCADGAPVERPQRILKVAVLDGHVEASSANEREDVE